MSKTRIIARLDVKGPNLIKGIQLEGLRVIGDPYIHALKYYKEGVDELLYMDTVASLYGRNNLTEIIEHTARDIFVPLTVGGGIRTVEDAKKILRCGADKVAVNTAAVMRPELLSELAENFGSQCVVLSIEAKFAENGRWQVYTENGRQPSGIDVIDWAVRASNLGAGEILLTSIDREGTRRGFDVELIKAVAREVSVPIIASGGMGTIQHLLEVVEIGGADAVAIADMIHYKRKSLNHIREEVNSARLMLDP
jgi:cyclase